MSDQKSEFTEAYAKDVKKRFEDLEAKVKQVEEFAARLGYVPSAQ